LSEPHLLGVIGTEWNIGARNSALRLARENEKGTEYAGFIGLTDFAAIFGNDSTITQGQQKNILEHLFIHKKPPVTSADSNFR